MNATTPAVSPGFAALNIDCADPAALADFWGKALGRPVLLTEHHDEEAERLVSLGARRLSEIKLPALRHSTLADPKGTDFDLVTWQSE